MIGDGPLAVPKYWSIGNVHDHVCAVRRALRSPGRNGGNFRWTKWSRSDRKGAAQAACCNPYLLVRPAGITRMYPRHSDDLFHGRLAHPSSFNAVVHVNIAKHLEQADGSGEDGGDHVFDLHIAGPDLISAGLGTIHGCFATGSTDERGDRSTASRHARPKYRWQMKKPRHVPGLLRDASYN